MLFYKSRSCFQLIGSGVTRKNILCMSGRVFGWDVQRDSNILPAVLRNKNQIILERICVFLPLMVSPSSTPLFFGNLTWNVPLLGTTDSATKTHRVFRTRRHDKIIKKQQISTFIQLNICNYIWFICSFLHWTAFLQAIIDFKSLCLKE